MLSELTRTDPKRLLGQSIVGGYAHPFEETLDSRCPDEHWVTALSYSRRTGKRWPCGLGYVLLANLVSYPVTWIVWPSLGGFQPISIRQTGAFIAFGAILFTGLLALPSRSEGKARRN